MQISFDLDDTLIPCGDVFETEKLNFLGRFFCVEKIRKRAPQLIRELKLRGHDIHIYTTSLRSIRKIRKTLFWHGIFVGKVINETTNLRELKKRNLTVSKYPPAFGFELHIDDSKGVGLEGERLSFATIIIDPKDQRWDKTILLKIQSFDKK